MKKLLFATVFLLATSAYSQEKLIYCELVGMQKMLSPKVTVSIDYGEQRTYFTDTRIKDENGKVTVFNSMIDALNYMGRDGWQFVQAYTVGGGSSPYVYHWLLKKEIPSVTAGTPSDK